MAVFVSRAIENHARCRRGLRLAGLKYEKLEIKELGLGLDGDGRVSYEAKRRLRRFSSRMLDAIED